MLLKRINLAIMLLTVIIVFNSFKISEVKGSEVHEDFPKNTNDIVKFIPDKNGDIIQFNIKVAESKSRITYRTLGWTIKINGIGIIYKYLASEGSDNTFEFRLSDLENEYIRQYGRNSPEHQTVKNVLYNTGGRITFDAIQTYAINRVLQGSIKNNPIYNKPYNYNFTGKVYTTLDGIRNAQSWSRNTKYVDLPKYFNIAYEFKSQPHVKGVVNIKYLDETGKEIKSQDKITRNFSRDKQERIKIDIPNISGYIYDSWEWFSKDSNKSKYYSENIEVTLSEQRPTVNVNINYTRKSEYPDLKVIDIGPLVYNLKTKVVTVVKIRNEGNVDISPEKPCSLKITFSDSVDDRFYIEKFNIGRNKEVLVPIVWEAIRPGNLKIEAEVNYDRSYNELNYDNNKMTKDARVLSFKETYTENPNPIPLISPPRGENNDFIEWREWRFSHWENINGINRPIYEEKSFYMRLIMDTNLSKGRMKSGYGFELNVPIKIETNYDKPEYIIPPQNVQVFLPETQYNGYLLLEGRPSYSAFWNFPENIYSVLKKRQHYIPIWFPDNTYYKFNVTAIDSYCPGGVLTKTLTPEIFIDGNMYEDDYTKREWIR